MPQGEQGTWAFWAEQIDRMIQPTVVFGGRRIALIGLSSWLYGRMDLADAWGCT
jgi:hypothetical protein